MEMRKDCIKICIPVLYFFVAAVILLHCEARSSRHKGLARMKDSFIGVSKKLRPLKHISVDPATHFSMAADSPFPLPPLEDTSSYMPPFSLPLDASPFCIFSPFIPSPPPMTGTPIIYGQPPPPQQESPITFTSGPPIYIPSPPGFPSLPPISSPLPNPPELLPSPPVYFQSPPESVMRPSSNVPSVPGSYGPSPPEYGLAPPSYTLGSPIFVPNPPVFQPPGFFPPPFVPSPPNSRGGFSLWCVAKPTVPEPIIQVAMNYACGSGAECESIQREGSCFQPDTVVAHASYAFNSYWQRTKAAGGTCDFGGTAMLITQDPSFDGCHFIYY